MKYSDIEQIAIENGERILQQLLDKGLNSKESDEVIEQVTNGVRDYLLKELLGQVSQIKVIQITLKLDALGKPRATQYTDSRGNHRAFHNDNYMFWRSQAEKTLTEQWSLGKQEQISKLGCYFIGCNRKNDADNSPGSVMDAMKKAGLIVDDNMRRIPWLESRWFPGYKEDPPRIEVEIELADSPLPKYLKRPKAPKVPKVTRARKNKAA